MWSRRAGGAAALALFGLGACTYPQQPPPQATAPLTVPGFVPAQSAALTATPTPPPLPIPIPPMVTGTPPAAQVEVIPPNPGSGAVWQPGHWQWTGAGGTGWAWMPGQYVAPPTAASQWVPGRWTHETGRGWLWVDGHWS